MDGSSEEKICIVCKLVLDKQAKMESKMDELAAAAGGQNCRRVLQIIATTHLNGARSLSVLASAQGVQRAACIRKNKKRRCVELARHHLTPQPCNT